jgi:hypothetical protein
VTDSVNDDALDLDLDLELQKTCPTDVGRDTKPKRSRKPTNAELEQGFDRFWAVYPRPLGKQKAIEKWREARRRGVSADHIVAAATQQAARWYAEGVETKFIKYPATWLHGGHYDDKPEPTRLTVVSGRPAASTYTDLYDRADAAMAARLIRAVWMDPHRKASDPDPTPYAQWVRARRREFIAANRDAITAALDARRAAG